MLGGSLHAASPRLTRPLHDGAKIQIAGRRRQAARRPGGQAISASLPGLRGNAVAMPIDFYSMLQVNPNVSRESISRAYEK